MGGDSAVSRALVTGGGGFIGKAICKALLKDGLKVRSFSRGDYPSLRELGIETMRGDISEMRAVARAVKDCDVIFHVAARFDLWGKRKDFIRTNVHGTQNVLDACRHHGIERLVYTSTPSVVHGGKNVEGVDESAPYPRRYEALYPETKAHAERMVLAASTNNLRTVAIRPHLVWGPEDSNGMPRLLQRARAGRLRLIGKPQNIDTTYIDNAVLAHLLAAEKLKNPDAACAGKAYFITQDELVTTQRFINDMLAAAGEPPITRSVPTFVARAAAVSVERVFKTMGWTHEPPVTRFMVSQLATAHHFNISAARRDLGYAPTVSYDTGMARLREWASNTTL